MSLRESIASEFRVISSMLRGQRTGGSQASRLDAFYAPQAGDYDRFRERLLHGRKELVTSLPLPRRARVAEIGAGTGRTAAWFGPRLDDMAQLDLVDLCTPLLDIARQRFAGRANVRVIRADSCEYVSDEPLDAIYFSYSLTMIPQWRWTLERALALLAPGGVIGAVDFTVMPWHGAVARRFWPRWFRHDGVNLDSDHVELLLARTSCVNLRFSHGTVPWMPGLRVPWYLYIGRKRADDVPRP
jgi:S-adenosylmethionine-diacylgycerolhomoserine-N-methlytransferase